MNPTPRPDNAASTSHTIMIVDDNLTNLQILIRILEGSGHRMLVAKSGDAAMRIVKHERPDLVLLDVQMPGMDGFEVCRALKADPEMRDVIVIFLSAQGDVTDKVNGLELGASDYITKPFQAEEVLARVAAHLHRRELEQRLRVSNDRLAQELRNAGAMQRLLLPTALPESDRITFAAHYRTSLHAGGDYYDVLPLDAGRFGVMVADVAGHGAGAAIVMAMIRTMLHGSGGSLERPDEVLLRLNAHFEYLIDTPLFATAMYAIIDPGARGIRFARAGHPPPILLRNGASPAPWNMDGSLPLFIKELASIPVIERELRQRDRLLFYTDGVIDLANPAGERFDLARLASSLARGAEFAATDQLDEVVRELDEFAMGREPGDDMTLLIAAID